MNEKELLKIAKTDENASNELAKKYKPLVINIAKKYYLIGGELDDLIQEGMIGLYRAILTFSFEKNAEFKTFATLCVNRQIQSAIKKANREKNKPFLDLYSADDEIVNYFSSTDPNPEDLAEQRETLKEFNDTINLKLSSKEREILMEYITGRTYEEIAEKLKITKKSVDNGLHRIKKKLEK